MSLLGAKPCGPNCPCRGCKDTAAIAMNRERSQRKGEWEDYVALAHRRCKRLGHADGRTRGGYCSECAGAIAATHSYWIRKSGARR